MSPGFNVSGLQSTGSIDRITTLRCRDEGPVPGLAALCSVSMSALRPPSQSGDTAREYPPPVKNQQFLDEFGQLFGLTTHYRTLPHPAGEMRLYPRDGFPDLGFDLEGTKSLLGAKLGADSRAPVKSSRSQRKSRAGTSVSRKCMKTKSSNDRRGSSFRFMFANRRRTQRALSPNSAYNLWATMARNLRVTKWLGPVPAVAVCSDCGREFKVPLALLKQTSAAQESLRKQFAEHKCAPQARDV